MRTETELVAEYGGRWTLDDAAASIGKSVPVTARIMRDKGVPLSVEEITSELFTRMEQRVLEDGLPYRPGALELLEEIHAEGLPQALVTMSFGAYVQAAVSATPRGAFSTIRTGDSVPRSKPAPDIFLAAAADLSLAPAQCLGIEDSAAGAAAILAAGVTPLVIPGVGAVPDLPGLLRWETLAGVRLADLRAAHAEYQAATAR